ncbi:MAG: chemotaxis protein CheB [Chitinophagaceae bacterium]|nr:MAG: chemotaxis protein CheB [Chitinophagaceae bacterium]
MLPQYLVAIGGSAGSFDALVKFFDHTLPDNATYIILRHVPANYKSELDQLLRKHTKLAVQEAKQGVTLMTDKVYYAPPYFHLALNGGKFLLIRRHHTLQNKAIDIFLESLAENENRGKAIVVILSGAGFDGVKGTAAIKKAGGLVIAQVPESCEFATMSQQIINKGYADFVLLPEEMPVVIESYVNRNKVHLGG